VYENKQNHDKFSLEKSDIYVEVTRILQKIAALDAQFAVNIVCAASFVLVYPNGHSEGRARGHQGLASVLTALARAGFLPQCCRKIKKLAENDRNWTKLYVIDIMQLIEGGGQASKKGELKNET